MAADIEVIWVRRERKSFCKQDWTGEITLIPKENFSFVVIPDAPRKPDWCHSEERLVRRGSTSEGGSDEAIQPFARTVSIQAETIQHPG
jgi:hypothetical protein